MPCKNCSCEECVDYHNKYCPDCGHHLKFHRKNRDGCSQPTCECRMIPIVKWEEIKKNQPVKEVAEI